MTDPESIRRAAIDHHHDQARAFEQHYEDMARSRFATAFTYGRHKVDIVIDQMLAELRPGAIVLDVGCGTGAYLERIAAHGLVPWGVEPAPAMLAAARTRCGSGKVEQGVATALPFPDGAVDAVFQIEVLRYLHREDIRQALAESWRVLRPGGQLLVTLVNRWALDGFYARQRLRQRLKGAEFDRTNPHCEFFTPSEARAELIDAGFSDVRAVGRLFAPFRIAYKASPSLASRLASRFERLDDRVHEWNWTTPFAGHLIMLARKPAS